MSNHPETEDLESRIRDRTVELTRANQALLAQITERRQAQEQLRRVNRAHRALSLCNQALTRATTESAFLHDICHLIVAVAGYRLCWVGYKEMDEAQTIRPVAQAGYEEGYLETVNVTWADTERGRGPTGTAVRTGQACVFKDVATEPAFAPWRAEALKRGYASVLAVPLVANGRVLGTLNIYAAEPDAFDDEELALLQTLANDLAYGVTALRNRIERARAEEELRRARDELEVRVAERTAELAWTNGLLQQEIAQRERVARRLAAQHAVTRVLAEAGTLAAATPHILAAIGESVGWELGVLWNVDQSTGLLRCVDVWHPPGDGFTDFEALTRALTCAPGAGLPGRVWAGREPVWTTDVGQLGNFGRAVAAARAGLRGAFALPVRFGPEVTGVLEFFSRTTDRPDDDLLATVGALGSQIGQFIERKRAEEDLSKSRERFELAMQGSGDGFWDWEVTGDVIYFSARWKGLLGFADDEIGNTTGEWVSRLHPDDRRPALAALRAYLDGRSPVYHQEFRLRHKDGSYRWILARAVALRDSQGKAYRLAGSHADITERKRAEQALARERYLLHCLMDNIPDYIYFKDRAGRFLRVNQALADFVGRGDPAALLGKTDFDLYSEGYARRAYEDEQEIIRTGQPLVAREEKETWPDGRVTWVSSTKAPLRDPDGQVIGTFGISRDITQRKQAEEELRRAKDAAEGANRAKSEFLAVMSHEIRTPMNGIVGMTELALDTELTAEQREYLTLVKKSADSLLTVINAILDFSKIEAGKVELDRVPFALRDLLGDTLTTLAVSAHQKGLELACHVAPEVPDALVGDPGRLRQVLINLVGNAIKFTESGEVEVRVELVSGGGVMSVGSPSPGVATPGLTTHLRFAVRDTGIGIPADKQRLVFDPFAQVDCSLTRKYPGTGLGLPISARLVEVMGGTVALDSEPGKGSTFRFTVPFDLAQGPTARPVPAPPVRVLGLPVLVVDDNATNRRILEEMLGHWGMRPVAVDGAGPALEVLDRAAEAGEPFSLILLDSHMPGTDGFALAELIRQRPGTGGAIIMLLTSALPPGHGARCRELGIVDTLLKPVRQADLWEAVLKALGAPVSVEPHKNGGNAIGLRPQRRLRILLAEDNPVNQKLAVSLLEKQGHTVIVANNGREALQQLQVGGQTAIPFDLVLMDVQMPEMDGLRTTAEIRRREAQWGGHLPIIAMTAYAMRGDRERCLAAGMDGYLSKPIQRAELRQAIEAVVPAGAAGEEPQAGRDWSKALAGMQGDRELLQELAALFLNECPGWLAEIQAALADSDPCRLQMAAHTLKGSLQVFVAQAACEAALRLEDMGRRKDLSHAGEACAALGREIDRLRPALAALARLARCAAAP